MNKHDFLHAAAKLEASHQPSHTAKEHIAKLTVLNAAGPTGVGKTTIIRRSGVPIVISDTTRAMRGNEIDGVDYHFRSDYQHILEDIEHGKYVQFTIGQAGEFYGTRMQAYPKEGVCTMSVLMRLIDRYASLGFKQVKTIFIIPPTYDEWMRRLTVHLTNDLQARLDEGREALALALKRSDVTFLVNNDLDTAVERFLLIADGHHDEVLESHATQVAEDILAQLQAGA